MREEDLSSTEALKMNHLSVEEVAARRAELAKMRELIFRAEAKAKRVAKIKSKTYRRIKKREKAKLGEVDEESGGEEDEEGRMKREVERARERATLRHKNTGKWAKAMKARGELDGDQRREINEMLERGDRLRRRIQGRGSDDERDNDSEDDDENGEDAVERIKRSAFDELEKMEAVAEETEGGVTKGKSVFEMKFMKDAMAKEKQRVEQMADDFVRELGEQDDPNNEDDDIFTSSRNTSSQRVGGRVSYRPGNTVSVLTSLPLTTIKIAAQC